MPRESRKICFEAKLLRPASKAEDGVWAFLILPKDASAGLPSRGLVTVEGNLNGHAFVATLQPDGRGSHWLKVEESMAQGANAQVGEVVRLEIRPVDEEPEPLVPEDLQSALDAAPAAKPQWLDITPKARRDWIFWIVSAKRLQTRERRIEKACDMLASGKRRVCCFDSSGVYGKGLAAPKAMDNS